MSSEQMQQVTVEFGYSETTFVLPPENLSSTARVRIFTPSREIPFAGHPNVGTAFVLAHHAIENGQTLSDTLHFEEIAGMVPVRLLKQNGTVTGAELLAPEALSCHSEVSAEQVAACLSLSPDDIRRDVHNPVVASVGLPFLIVELVSRDALRRCVPNLQGFRAILPLDGAVSVYTYTLDRASDESCDLQARMFTPRMTEDPATGSAAAAATALLALRRDQTTLSLKISQGVDMGRTSVLFSEYDASSGRAVVRVGGECVITLEGTFTL